MNRGRLMVDMCLDKQQQESILENYDLDEEMSVTNFSDDSIADPDFDPETNNNSNNRLRSLDSSLESVEETSNDLPQMDNPFNETASTSTSLQPPIKRRQKENRNYKRLSKNEKVARDKEKHPMKPLCTEKCTKKCGSTFSEEERFRIWEEYWLLDYSSRRKWLAKNVQMVPVLRRTVQAQPGKGFAKNESRKFLFPKEDKSRCVCRKFFLNTLGYSNDSVITELCTAMKKIPLLAAVRENRGTTGNYKRKRERTIIMNHINKFKPCITHYRRHNAPNMRYLSRDLTVQSMFDDFEREHPGFCKIELYRKTIKLLHISLCMPKSDVCVECETYKNKSQANDVEELTFVNDEEWNTHKNKAKKATDKYHEDAMIPDNQNVRVYSMDLQKVILIPNMPSVKDSHFLSRLTAFNLTFASLKKKSSFKNYCSMWHEGLAGRDGNHIVDAIFRVFEEERDVKEFIIWSDNCTGQNKNWILYTSLVWLVNQANGPDCVAFRYLTKGHTHMSADGIHGNIETKINKIGNIYDYNDLTEAVMSSRKGLQVLDVNVFHKWEKKRRQVRKNAKESDSLRGFLLNPIVEVCFKKGKRSLDYKTDFDQEEYISLDFLQKKFNFQSIPEVLPVRGVLTSKKNEIIRVLGRLMPINRLKFWKNLHESDSAPDLVEEYDNTNLDDSM